MTDYPFDQTDAAVEDWLYAEDSLVSQFVPAYDPWEQDDDYDADGYYESQIDSYAEASLFGWDS